MFKVYKSMHNKSFLPSGCYKYTDIQQLNTNQHSYKNLFNM